MTITVELASTLAQIVPVFLIVLLFEGIVSTRNVAVVRFGWARLVNVTRLIASLVSVLLLIACLIVIGTGTEATGIFAAGVLAGLAALIAALCYTIYFTFVMTKRRIDLEEQAENEEPRERQAPRNRNE